MVNRIRINSQIITVHPTCPSREAGEIFTRMRAIAPNGFGLIDTMGLRGDATRLEVLTTAGISFDIYPSNSQIMSKIIYLALGDSYSSGEGDIDATGITHYIPGTNVLGNYKDGIPRELCHVSDRSYPFLLAKDMQLSRGNGMQSMACSGAVRDDVYTNAGPSFTYAQYAGQNTPLYGATLPRLQNVIAKESLKQEALNAFIPGRIQQIELVKKYQPKVATIGISGNDLGFGNILMACIQKFADTCDYAKPAGLADLGSVIQANYDQQLALYRALKQASPGTDFYAVGYPQFINGDKAYCWSILDSLNEQERLMISNAVTFANQTIKNAASAAGIKYINIEDVLKDYSGDICSGSGLVTDPLHKVLAGNVTEGLLGRFEDSATPTSTSPLTDYINKASKTVFREYTENPYYYPMQALAMYFQETFHPNALGHKAMYNFIHAHQNGTSLLDDECDGVAIICPSQQMAIVPNVPDYFGKVAAGTMFRDIVHVESGAPNGFTLQSGLASAPRGSVVRVALSESVYAQGAELEIRIGTDGRLIGKTLAGPLGGFMQQIVLSADLTVGYYFVSVQGNNTKYQQLILITGQKGDMDADGISDTTDTCEFINPIGKDDDNDGIDDACDLSVEPDLGIGPVTDAPLIKTIMATPDNITTQPAFFQQPTAAPGGDGGYVDLRNRFHISGLSVIPLAKGSTSSLGYVALLKVTSGILVILFVLMIVLRR